MLLYRFIFNRETNVSSRKAKHPKHKSRAAKVSVPQGPEDLVPSEEFTEMILDEQKNGNFREVDADDLIAELQANINRIKHMKRLQVQSQSCLAKIGAPKDVEEAMTWLLRAAARGDADAQHHLGLMYAKRPPEPQDHLGLRDRTEARAKQSEKNDAEAMFWLVQAAEQGHSESTLAVGLMYDAGLGCPRNPAEAVKWIQKAADQGNEAAHNWLACKKI